MNDITQEESQSGLRETKLIEFTSEMESSPTDITLTTYALGRYLEELQENYDFAPIFPLKLLPMPKDRYKKWGFAYATLTVKNTRELKRFQQDAALSYSRFQTMTDEQWEAIKSDSINDLSLYCVEMKDKGVTEINIPKDYQNLIDSYLIEYNGGVIELHEHLRSSKKGCLIPFLLMCLTLVFLMTIVS